MECRKSLSQKLRMDGRDYARPGWYFVTLGADYHRHIFGRVEQCAMHASALGALAERCWSEIPVHYAHIQLGAWQLMPNHFHGLVRIARPGGKGLGEVMNVFKGAVTREWRRACSADGVGSRYSGKVDSRCSGKVRVWAPNYYDVICFDAEELAVRERYIKDNPRRWALRDVPEGRIKQSRFRGNLNLLQQAGIRRALRVSRKATEQQIEDLQRELARFDGIVCGTFFSPGERACLQTLLDGSARVVWVLPMAMPKGVPRHWTDAMLQNRALWLCAFPDEQEEATRLSCQQANRWVQQFCNEKDQ